MTISEILLIVACVLAGYEIVKLVASGWKPKLPSVKRDAQDLSIKLREYGLKFFPGLLEDFVVGDVIDMLKKIRDLSIVVKAGDEAIMQELDGTFERVLEKKLKTEVGRATIKARLIEAEAK